MDSQSALALIDESADRPPMKGDSQGLSQGLQAKYRDRITGVLHLPGKAAVWAPLPADLPPALASALKARGIDKLYSHQAESWSAVREGKHVVVVTPTASGKSL